MDDFKAAMAKIQHMEPDFSQLQDSSGKDQEQIAWKSQFTRSATTGDFTKESVKSFTKWMHETYCATYDQHLKVKLQKHTRCCKDLEQALAQSISEVDKMDAQVDQTSKQLAKELAKSQELNQNIQAKIKAIMFKASAMSHKMPNDALA